MASDIGIILKISREEKNLTIEQAAEALKIRGKYLTAIEGGKLDDIPAGAYRVGYLRNYANWLGLDGDNLADRFKSEENIGQYKEISLPQLTKEELRPKKHILLFSMIALILIFTIYHFATRQKPDIYEILDKYPSHDFIWWDYKIPPKHS